MIDKRAQAFGGLPSLNYGIACTVSCMRVVQACSISCMQSVTKLSGCFNLNQIWMFGPEQLDSISDLHCDSQ